MSSNIRVNRICQHCNKSFIARTTVTKYCSDTCAKRAYKARKRAEKLSKSEENTREIIEISMQEINSKDYLSIDETCRLLSISRWTLWRKIKSNQLKTGSFGKRKLIRRCDIDKYIKQSIKQK